MTATAFERITAKLREQGKKVRANGTKANAQCPAHEDRNPSLSITAIEGGVLAYCHAGCQIDDILAAIELRKSDLYDNAQGYSYQYADGAQAHRRYDQNGKKTFYQTGHIAGAQTTLYRLDAVQAAVTAGRTVYLVEGEQDVHALETLGVVATTARGGAENVHKADLTPLHGGSVIAVVDKDAAGYKWCCKVTDMLDGKADVKFVQARVGKDAADHIAAGHWVGDFMPFVPPPTTEEEYEASLGRWLNLDEYLDGTYTPPQPSIGAARDDEIQLLYPGRWHTVVGLMTAGKTSLALWHVKAALAEGGHVIYVHFEEPDPGGIIHRLLGLGVSKEVIRKRFHWPEDGTVPWEPGEMASGNAQTVIHLTIPAKAGEEGAQRDKYDELGVQVVTYLQDTKTRRFESVNALAVSLRAKGVTVPQNDLAPALERLANNGVIVWPDQVGKSRPGWLPDEGEEP